MTTSKKTNLKPVATIKSGRDSLTKTSETLVEVTWTGAKLDRPTTMQFAFGAKPSDMNLAKRLAKMINDGAFYKKARIVKDKYGKTYVEADTVMYLHRQANASLSALGY